MHEFHLDASKKRGSPCYHPNILHTTLFIGNDSFPEKAPCSGNPHPVLGHSCVVDCIVRGHCSLGVVHGLQEPPEVHEDPALELDLECYP